MEPTRALTMEAPAAAFDQRWLWAATIHHGAEATMAISL